MRDSVGKLPKLPPAAGGLPRRGPFLSGDVRAYFAPGQTPVDALDYRPPTGWPRAGELLRAPRAVWISLCYGGLQPEQEHREPVTNKLLYTSQVFTPTDYPEEKFDDVFVYFDETFTNHVTIHAYKGLPYVPGPVIGHYDDGSTESAVIRPEFTAWHADVRLGEYLALRESLIALLAEIHEATGGSVATIYTEWDSNYVGDGPPIESGRPYYLGSEILDGEGTRLFDFYDFPAGRDLDGKVLIGELPTPTAEEEDAPWLGTEILHVFIGLPTGIGGYEGPVEADSPINTPDGRVGIARFLEFSPRFAGYRAHLFGMRPWEVPNYNKGTALAPPSGERAEVPTDDADLVLDPGHSIQYSGWVETAEDFFEQDGDVQPGIFRTYTLYNDRQLPPEEFEQQYQDELAAYNSTTGPDGVDSYPHDWADRNAVLAGEAEILAEHGVSYEGEADAGTPEAVRTLVMDWLGLG